MALLVVVHAEDDRHVSRAGAYVPIFGYERSAQYPFGHRNMFFAKRTDARVTPFFLKEGVRQFEFPLGAEGDEPGSGSRDLVKNDQRLLYEEVRAHTAWPSPHTHVHQPGRPLADNDPDAGAGGRDLPGRAHQFRAARRRRW